MAAALREDPSGQPPESSAAHSPRYVFVVKAGKPLTFNALREVASPRPDLLGVTFDRRWMGDRRLQQGSGHAEQRRRQRRSRTVDSEWLRSGFVLSVAATSQGEVSPARVAQHPAGRQVRRAASPVAAATSPAGAVSVSDAASVRPPAAAEWLPFHWQRRPSRARRYPQSDRPTRRASRPTPSAWPRTSRSPLNLRRSRAGESAGTREPIDLGAISPVDAKTTPVQPVAAASESVQPAPGPVEPVPPSVERVAVPTVAPLPTSVNVEPAAPAGGVAGPAAATPTPSPSQGEVSPARVAQHPAGGRVRRVASPVAAAASPAEAVPVSDAASVRPPAAAAVAPVPLAAATESREAISPIGPADAAGIPPHAERVAKDVAPAAEAAPVGESAGTREPIDLGAISPVDAKTTPVQPVAAASESVQPAPGPVEPVPPTVERVAVPTMAPPPTSVNVEPAAPAGAAGSAAATPTPSPDRAASSGTTGRARSHVHQCRRCGHISRHDGTCAIATITDLIQCPVCDVAPSRPVVPSDPVILLTQWSPLARHRPLARRGPVVALARRGSVVARWRRRSRVWRSCRPCGGSVRTRGLRTGWREFSRISESPSMWAATGRLPRTTSRPPDPDRRPGRRRSRPSSRATRKRRRPHPRVARINRSLRRSTVCRRPGRRLRASTPRHRRQYPPHLSSARLPHHRRRLSRSGSRHRPRKCRGRHRSRSCRDGRRRLTRSSRRASEGPRAGLQGRHRAESPLRRPLDPRPRPRPRHPQRHRDRPSRSYLPRHQRHRDRSSRRHLPRHRHPLRRRPRRPRALRPHRSPNPCAHAQPPGGTGAAIPVLG